MERGLISNTTSRIQLFWSDILSSTSAKIWYFVSFCNYFGICVQFLQICFVFCIILRRYLFSFCNLCSVSAILVFCSSLLLHYGYQ